MITEQDILRFLEGNASAIEVEQMESWLALSTENASYFNSIKSIWNASASIKNYQSVDIDAEWNEFNKLIADNDDSLRISPQINPKRQFNFLPYSIAASLAILIAAFFYLQAPSPKQVDETPILSEVLSIETLDESKTLTLSDKTVVLLDSFSTMEYSSSFDLDSIRQVSLVTGSAVFDVTHDEEKKFVVLYDEVAIEVLGTKFQLGKSNGHVNISLKSGSIKAYEIDDIENSITMIPGDSISFAGQKFISNKKPVIKVIPKKVEKPIIKPEAPVQIEKEEPVIVEEEFKGGTYRIRDVLDFLNKTYGKQIKIDKRLGVNKDDPIRIDIHQESLELILIDLEKATTLSYKPGKCDDCFRITSGSKK